MNSKVTLYSEKDLIEKMKKYAKEHNTSLSQMVNQFFYSVLEKSAPYSQIAEKTKKLQGILKEKSFDKEDYKSYLEEKYL